MGLWARCIRASNRPAPGQTIFLTAAKVQSSFYSRVSFGWRAQRHVHHDASSALGLTNIFKFRATVDVPTDSPCRCIPYGLQLEHHSTGAATAIQDSQVMLN